MKARDLEDDLKIIEAAPIITMSRCQCGDPDCKSFLVSITRNDGRLDFNDAQFIAEARSGWPYAIRRAMEAEAEVDRLRNEINILQEQLQQHHISRNWD